MLSKAQIAALYAHIDTSTFANFHPGPLLAVIEKILAAVRSGRLDGHTAISRIQWEINDTLSLEARFFDLHETRDTVDRAMLARYAHRLPPELRTYPEPTTNE